MLLVIIHAAVYLQKLEVKDLQFIIVRSAISAASQLPGRGPTDVDDAPAPAR